MGGHYTAYAKNRNEGWYYFDDSSARKIDETDLLTKEAYLLFFISQKNIKLDWPDLTEDIPVEPEKAVNNPPSNPVKENTPKNTPPSPKDNMKELQPMHHRDNDSNESHDDEMHDRDSHDDEMHMHRHGHHGHGHHTDDSQLQHILHEQRIQDMKRKNEILVCEICNQPLPSLEEFHVHLLTEHYDHELTKGLFQ